MSSLILRKKQKRLDSKSNLQLLLLALPALIKILVFSYIPMAGLVVSFQFYMPPPYGIWYSPFVGWDNFMFLFKSSLLERMITNVLILNIVGIFLGTVVSVVMGLLMFEITKKLFIKASQTVIIFPFFLAWPLVGTLLVAIIGDKGLLTNLIYKGTADCGNTFGFV